ncbi:UNVERIFIED_CONTAM: hypothetical protein K2H54_006899, partial [Gekko kuhli]
MKEVFKPSHRWGLPAVEQKQGMVVSLAWELVQEEEERLMEERKKRKEDKKKREAAQKKATEQKNKVPPRFRHQEQKQLLRRGQQLPGLAANLGATSKQPNGLPGGGPATGEQPASGGKGQQSGSQKLS